jgi:hypothetical protein
MSDLSGLQVQCPQCKRVLFLTTGKYDPTKAPNGGMVKSKVPWHIDWLTTKGTKAAEMTCPECLGQLAHSGSLIVKVPTARIAEVYRALFPEDYMTEEAPIETPKKKGKR